MNIEDLPDSYTIPNPHNIPVHDQGNKMNCTSHAYASLVEYKLSDYFKERTLVDVDDLWEKQKKFGTASEESGDRLDGPFTIGEEYGIRFKTDSGRKGIYYPGKGIKLDSWFTRPLETLRESAIKSARLVKQGLTNHSSSSRKPASNS